MKTKNFCMRVAAYDGKYRWSSHIIVEAKNFEDACEKAKKYCEENSSDSQGFIFRGTGYDLNMTGRAGCKW